MSLTKLRQYWHAAALSGEITIKQVFVDAFVIFTVLVQPMIIALLALWMLQARGGDQAMFVVVGSGMTGLWSSLLFVCGNSITGERWTGTLENLVAVPIPLQVIVFGKNLASVLQSLLSMVVSYTLVAWLFQLDVRIAQPGLFIASLVVTVVAFICFGLIIASLFIISPAVQHWQNGLEFPVYILCGFLFPIALLPGWTTPLSWLLTPYWAGRALQASAAGRATPQEMLLCWGMMLGFSALYLLGSRWLFRYVLYKARVEGTLGMQ
ncbi:MAG: ABC transporter permease [Anaerolineales bacterium]|nr:ABC transporter permease [Anaerolineales bacterium]